MKTKKEVFLPLLLILLIASVFNVFNASSILSLTVFASNEDHGSNFIATVELLENENDINLQEVYLESAKSHLELYINNGGAVTDADISSAYEKYSILKLEIDEVIESCLQFTQYVEAAENSYGYTEKKDNLLKAELLLDKIDTNYSGVSASLTVYTNMCNELISPERACENYITKAAEAASGINCEDVKRKLAEAKRLKELIEIYDYPGLDEADENLTKAEQFLSQRALEAIPFLMAVENIYESESIPEGVRAAYEALENIDKTAEGVASAVNELKKIENDYNKRAENANDISKELNELIFAFIF